MTHAARTVVRERGPVPGRDGPSATRAGGETCRDAMDPDENEERWQRTTTTHGMVAADAETEQESETLRGRQR